MRIGNLVHGRLPLLRDLHEQRERELRVQKCFAKTLRSLEHGVTGVEPCTSCRRSDGLDPESRSAGHGSNLGLREARQRFNTRHLPDELAQDDDLRRLTRVELVHDVFE